MFITQVLSADHSCQQAVACLNARRVARRLKRVFRDESRGADFWANRNRIEENVLVNSGGPTGIAIDIQGKTKDVQFVRNVIRESRAPMQRVGIRISAASERIEMTENQIEGVATDIQHL